MSTRIGLISDVHAMPAPLQEALLLFRQQGIEQVFCMGDIAGYGSELEATIDLLREYDCQSILGNHDQWYLDASEYADTQTTQFFCRLPLHREMTIEGVTVYMVHASPPDSCMDGIRLLAQNGMLMPEQQQAWSEQLAGFEPDVLVVGHTHQLFTEKLASTLVINPGSTRFNHSCAILSLPDCTVEWFGLSGSEPQRIWNWSGGLLDV